MSSLVSHNVYVDLRKTSIRLETVLWDGLAEVCQREGWTRHEVVAAAVASYPDRGMASAVRTYLVVYFRVAGVE